MSHNDTKIGTAKPDRQGDISPSINDLGDVAVVSAASNQVLKYNSTSSAWENGGAPANTPYMFIGAGESNDYSNTGNTGAISTGDAWYLYQASPTNNISGASITKIGATDWIDYITLPAGHYVVDAQFYAEWTASGYLEVALFHSVNNTPTWSTATTEQLSHKAYIGATLSPNAISNVITGHFEITSAMVTAGENLVRLQVTASSNLKAYDGATSQGNTPAEFNYFFIRQVAVT
jgi:hypothetical protein